MSNRPTQPAPARALAIGAAMAILVFGVVAPAGPGRAQARGPQLVLEAQDPSTPLGGTVSLTVLVEGAPSGATLVATAHPALGSRAAFDRTTDGSNLGGTLDQVAVPLDTLVPDSSGERVLALGLESADGPSDPARLALRRSGVYPLGVTLRGTDDRDVADFLTYVIVTDPAPGAGPQHPLGVAWVWPLATAPSVLPDGTEDPAVLAALRPNGRLGRQAAALRRTSVPITVVPGPETFQAWSALSHRDPAVTDGSASIRDVFGRGQVLSSTYVPTDIPSLLNAGLAGAVDAEYAAADDTLRRLLVANVSPQTQLARPVDPATLVRLRARGTERVVVESSALAGTTANRPTLTQPFTLTAGASPATGVTLNAVAADSGLEHLLTAEGSGALRAQRLLAGLAMVAQEQPGAARAVVVANPEGLDPPAELIDGVLTGLASIPWLAPMTLDQAFVQIEPEAGTNGAAVTRQLGANDTPEAPVTAARYYASQSRLAAFGTFLPPGDPSVAEANRALLSSVSSAWNVPGGGVRAQGELAAVDTTIDGFLNRVHVPDSSTVTLTSGSGEVPLTFRNDTGQTLSVLVTLTSQKLSFPDGGVRVIELPPRSTTVSFAVDARTSGTFPLQVDVRSVDRALEISNRTFRVRSTAVSTVGVVLTAGAVAFLVLWWGFDIRRRRRRAAPDS